MIPEQEYDKEKASDALKKAEFVFNTLTKYLKEKYKIRI